MLEHHTNSSRDSNVARWVLRCLIGAILLLHGAGCDGGVESAATTEAESASSSPDEWRFNSPQAFIDYAQEITDDNVRAGIFDHMYARSLEEQWAAARLGEIARAEQQYRAAMIKQFGSAAIDAIGPQMRTIIYPTANDNVVIEPHGESRVFVQFSSSDSGSDETIVLANIRGEWVPHATSITNGSEIVTLWCNDFRRAYFGQCVEAYSTFADDVEDGRYTDPQQAHRALAARLADLKRQFIPND